MLEVLREPLESGEIHISRASAQVRYPSQFTLVAALNPCQCGYFGSQVKGHSCKCTPDQVRQYRRKISGPLLDRIDLQVPVNHISASELQNMPHTESSDEIRARVYKARKKQETRQRKSNAQLSKKEIERYCILDSNSKIFLNSAVDKLSLSARAYDKILKTARTIADLANSNNIMQTHISEAIAFRNFDR